MRNDDNEIVNRIIAYCNDMIQYFWRLYHHILSTESNLSEKEIEN